MVPTAVMPSLLPSSASLARFHAGDSATMEECYREHFGDVRQAAGRVLRGADRDTVVHNVFYRLLSDASLRESFRGGNLAAWLTTVTRNEAIDFARKYAREAPLSSSPGDAAGTADVEQVEARLAIDRFRRERLPKELAGVFDARFLQQLTQRDAADALGIPRSTLVYQEQQVRAALRSFFKQEQP
jgi:RNA polymerase sigma-70 factor (ECF subfamily)